MPRSASREDTEMRGGDGNQTPSRSRERDTEGKRDRHYDDLDDPHRDDGDHDRDDRERRRRRDRSRGREREDERERRERKRERSYDSDRERERRERKRDRERDRERERDRDRDDDDRERRRSDKEKRRRRRDSRSPSPDRRRRREERAAAKAARREAERQASLAAARERAQLPQYADNPFNDPALNEKFTWHKKAEKEKKLGLSKEEVARRDALRRKEAEEELAKLNKKRAEREVERALREEEEARNRRAAEDAAMTEWVAREDSFLLEQSRRRAGIRLREQRAKAIDFVAINLRFANPRGQSAASRVNNPHAAEVEREDEEQGWGWADAGFEFEIDEPYKIFENLSMSDCIELEQDIQMYRSLERAPTNIDFWDAMLVVCQHHLARLRDPDRGSGGRRFNGQVDKEATKIVEGLSTHRLVDLEEKTRGMLVDPTGGVDAEFWETVLDKIHLQKAITKLNAIHEVVLRNRLEQFKKRQREDAARAAAEIGGAEEDGQSSDGDLDPDYDGPVEADLSDNDETYDAAMSLPTTADGGQISTATYGSRPAPNEAEDNDLKTERHWRAKIAAEALAMGDDEDEVDMEEGDLAEGLPATYDWGDKYRPRKPRYYNRVHTGYEWTQYNQSHYDKENPPPKVVMGYRFHVFYPDLIDKSTPPSYERRRIPGDDDTELLVFRAGPPYEDVAFRIVRKQWDYSHRRGFRSHFDRGVLQLAFKFQRDTYRK